MIISDIKKLSKKLKSFAEFEEATKALIYITGLLKISKKNKEEELEPLKKEIEKIESKYKEADEEVKPLASELRRHINDFVNEDFEATNKKEQDILDQLDKGEITFQESTEAYADIERLDKIEDSMGTLSFRNTQDIKIEISELPKEYLVPDMAKIKRDLKKGDIKGVTLVTKKTINIKN